MKHEKFRVFMVPASQLNSKEVEAFLSNPKILPRSLSINDYYSNQKLIVLGYEEIDIPTGDTYHIIEAEIPDVAILGLMNIGPLMEAKVAEMGGVICQDVHFIGQKAHITLLTTK
jgi:hypothetical protein